MCRAEVGMAFPPPSGCSVEVVLKLMSNLCVHAPSFHAGNFLPTSLIFVFLVLKLILSL